MVRKATIFHREKDRKTHHTPPAFGRKTFMCQNKAHKVFRGKNVSLEQK